MKHYLLNFHTYEGFNFNSKLLEFMFYFLWKKNVIRILWVLSDFMLVFFRKRNDDMVPLRQKAMQLIEAREVGVSLCVMWSILWVCPQSVMISHWKYQTPYSHKQIFVQSCSFLLQPSLMEFFISKQWINKFNTFAEPGPISNDDFLCKHGGNLSICFVNIPWFTLIPCQII